MTISLRPYQSALVDDVREQWAAGARNVLMHLATGGGKTACLGSIVEAHQGASCVIAHRSELVSQVSQSLAQYGVTHDVICSDATRRIIAAVHVQRFGKCYLRPGALCRVASVDTLIRRAGLESWAATVTLWVVDEGHHLVIDNKWHKAVEAFNHPHAHGLLPTATPCRADGKGLGRHADGVADVMVSGPSPRWLIEEGWLSDYDVVCPTSDMEMLADVAASGDWSQKALKEASKRSHIVGDVVQSYLSKARGRLGVTFATDVETATAMAGAYREAGVPSEVLTGETDDRLRASILQRFERREVMQLCVVDIVSEGFDLPSIEVLSMARPTQSLGLYSQQFGRGLRPVFAPGYDLETREGRLAAQAASGKGRKMLLIDHVGNFIRHQGGPDAPRVWTLDRRDRKSSQPTDVQALRVCTGCLKPFKRLLTECPHCGEPIPAPGGRAGPEQVDGDLALLSPEVLEALRAELPVSEGEYRERLMASRLPEIPLRANMKRHGERLDALATLRHEIAVWSGRLHAEGLSDREINKAFYLTFGLSTIEALSLGRKEAEALRTRINPFSVPLPEPAGGWMPEREMERAPEGYWTDDRIKEEALEYKTRSAFAKDSGSAYNLALSRGILDDVCSHMKEQFRWADENIAQEAKKYSSRKDFMKGARGAYNLAWRSGILDEICSHMTPTSVPNGYWTRDRVSEEAKKYPTREAFRKGSPGAYNVARKTPGLRDELFPPKGDKK